MYMQRAIPITLLNKGYTLARVSWCVCPFVSKRYCIIRIVCNGQGSSMIETCQHHFTRIVTGTQKGTSIDLFLMSSSRLI